MLRTLALASALLAAGCALAPARGREPVPAGATRALREALATERARPPRPREEAWDALRRARELAPDWTAPERLRDDLLLEELRGPEALEARLRSARAEPPDAGALYLAGRLQGTAGEPVIERARRADPAHAWSWHGLAWHRLREGRAGAAVARGEEALARARDPYERATFATALARYLRAAGENDRAVAVLREALVAAGGSAGEESEPNADETELAAQLASYEMGSDDEAMEATGLARALGLLAQRDLTESEAVRLAAQALGLPQRGAPDLRESELLLALSAREGPGRKRAIAELAARFRPGALASARYALAASEGERSVAPDPGVTAQRLAAGVIAPAIEAWRARQPAFLVDGEGEPLHPTLRAVVRVARATAADDADGLARLGDALLSAGWFLEARGLAEHLARLAPERAVALDDAAIAGRAIVAGMARAIGDGPGDGSPPSRGLDAVVAALTLALERWGPALWGDVAPASVAEELASPRIRYGPFAEILHPGPIYSEEDARAGRGPAGGRVPGLAAVFDALGRFALLGELRGEGADGVMLRRLAVLPVEGSHLGVPFSGSAAWCEGFDRAVGGGVGTGARIHGAAVHEGYWIDVGGVRTEHEDWMRLWDDFLGADAELDGERALAVRGIPLELALLDRDGRRARRGSWVAPLGEGDRIRLAILADRAGEAGADAGGLVPLEELLDVTALHEEGHLCDRTRFLPLSENLGRALAFAFASGFSPRRIAARLEERAQLVALAVAPDPRIPLAQVVGLAEDAELEGSAHAEGYAALAAKLLDELDRRIEESPESFPRIDPDRYLVHQLHRLGPEEVRTIALALAREEGLVAAEG